MSLRGGLWFSIDTPCTVPYVREVASFVCRLQVVLMAGTGSLRLFFVLAVVCPYAAN